MVFMKSFYEKSREDQNELTVITDGSRLYPPHFHENVEIFVSLGGGYKISVNEVNYTVGAGELLFIDSYSVHSYDEKLSGNEKFCLFLIPWSYLGKFRVIKGTRAIECPHVKDLSLCNELVSIYENYMTSQNENVRVAAVDLALAMITSRFSFKSQSEKDESSLIKRLLVYAQENFRGDASIADFSAKTGYSKEHLSRVFHKFFKISFPEYVNTLRFDYVQNEIAAGENKKITSILFDAGFKSIQSYYRFKGISAKSNAVKHN